MTKTEWRPGRRGVIALGAGAALMAPHVARAQALVAGGETIADATLLAAAKAEGVLTMYGSLPTRNWQVAGDAFQRETGIRIDYINLISPRIFARANAEFAAGRLTADWVDTTEVLMAKDWADRGLLRQPYKVPQFDRMAPELRDADGIWYSIFRTPYVLCVNTEVVTPDEHPKNWQDLLHPRWRGRLGLPSIDSGGALFNAYAFLREKFGEGYLRGLAAQRPKIYPSSTPLLTDLVRGEVALTFTAPASIRSQLDQGAPLRGIFPEEGVSAYPTTGGITTTAPHPNAARLYLNWMTSLHGSNILASSGIYGSNPDAHAPTAPGFTLPTSAGVWTMPLDRWAAQRDAYLTSWRTIFGTR
ncbi:ABC transporter substrate-binding protein [Humitalea sp. 24SJ18S-53]|uniref:ABC transporter substrate-binding protein n=1 Tax=Humitalea sp. 24SJ18S-53 TaxID=3422307 RepID=UPI003D67476F